MFKKVICLVLSLVIFQSQAGVPSQQDQELVAYLEKSNLSIEKLANDLPLEAKDEILALSDLPLEESQPIVENILSHYNNETGANYMDRPEWTDTHSIIAFGALFAFLLFASASSDDSDNDERYRRRRYSSLSRRSPYGCHYHNGSHAVNFPSQVYHCHF